MEFLLAANVGYVVGTFALYTLMKRRDKGFDLKPIITVYNVICVLAAGYVVLGISIHKWNRPGRFACNELDTSADGQHMAWVFWAFYAQKFWEFLDTWFFILRKSFRQVSAQHCTACVGL